MISKACLVGIYQRKLEEIARQVRIDVVTMLNAAGSGHTGGSLSATDLLVALFFGKINLDPFNPKWVRRDRFVLSKGHAAPAYYAVLSRLGFFDREELLTLRKFGSCPRESGVKMQQIVERVKFHRTPLVGTAPQDARKLVRYLRETRIRVNARREPLR